MAKRAKRVMEPDWVETRIKCTFPQALRLVQRGRKASRTGWDPSILYISRNRTLGLVELVCGGKDGEGIFYYSVPYLGGAGIGGPPVKDLLAEDWFIVEEDDWFTPEFLREEIPVPTLKGGKRAEAALLAEIADEERRA